MNYIRWRIGEDIRGRFPLRGVVEVYTEVEESGRVTREIGVDATGTVLYLAPCSAKPLGLFNGQVIEPTEREDDISPEAFERLWASSH